MACTNCNDKVSGVCKVCELLDDDTTVKTVVFCNTCGVYICNSCNTHYARRFAAYLKAKIV